MPNGRRARKLWRASPTSFSATRKTSRLRKNIREPPEPWHFRRSLWPGNAKRRCAPGMRRPPLLPRHETWMSGSPASQERGLRKCAKPCRPFAIGGRKSWRVLTHLSTRLRNGFVESKNNRTKALMRQGYGYRNRRNLRLRILLEVASWISANFPLQDGEQI